MAQKFIEAKHTSYLINNELLSMLNWHRFKKFIIIMKIKLEFEIIIIV